MLRCCNYSINDVTTSVINNLEKLFISLEGLDPAKDSGYVLAFLMACVIIGVVAIVFDLCYLAVVGKSALRISHSVKRTALLFLVWPLGSAVFGYLGLVSHILQPTILGALAAGFTWSTSTKSVLERVGRADEPEQDAQDEEES